MTKITLNNVGSLIDSTTAQTTINANNAIIQTAFDNTLSRDGTAPNTMSNNFDMNNNQILNLPYPATGSSPLRLQDASTLNGGGTISTIPAGGTTGQFLSKTNNLDYNTQWSNAGSGTVTSVGLTAPADFTVTGSPVTTTGTIALTLANTATGTGGFVRQTTPTLVTPILGVATATSVNKVGFTQPATGSTLTINDGVTLTASANATVSGTNTGDQTIILTGDVTGSGGGSFATTIAANAVTNAKLNTAPAYTLKANNSAGVAVPTDMDVTGLTLKASPGASDLVLIQDVSASNAFKKVTVSSLSSAGSVSSIGGNTGAFTLAYPLGNSVNDLRYVGPTNCGQLTYISTSVLAFAPYNGDTLRIAGTIYQIPTAGIAGLGNPASCFLNGVAAQTLAINTTYYIYAFNNGGTVTADFSATGHVISSTGGNIGTEIKSGDNTRTLIGMTRTAGTVTFLSDLTTISWFNRRNKTTTVIQNMAAAGNSTGINFMSWADESYWIGTSGVLSNSGVFFSVWQDRIDTVNNGTTSQCSVTVANAQNAFNSMKSSTSTEGYHTYDSNLSATGGTPNASGTSFVQTRG